jgi:nitrous oxide reductase accessory protein NosL
MKTSRPIVTVQVDRKKERGLQSAEMAATLVAPDCATAKHRSTFLRDESRAPRPEQLRHIFMLLAVSVAWLTSGCGPTADRCRKCGMAVDDHPRWIAGMIARSGEEARFCSPRCLFAYLRSPRGEGGRDAWVTEYYSQQRTPVPDIFFVIGSDITGPMGKALVPVAGRAAAERFRKDHHGTRVLSADEITADLLRELAGKPAATNAPSLPR